MPKKKSVTVAAQPAPTNSFPSLLAVPRQQLPPLDKLAAWDQTLSSLVVGCSRVEDLTVCLVLLFYCVKKWPRYLWVVGLMYFRDHIRERVPNTRREVLEQCSPFDTCALGPVKLGQQWYSSAHKAILTQGFKLNKYFIEHNCSPKWFEKNVDRFRADICKFLEPLQEDIRLAGSQLAREQALLAERQNPESKWQTISPEDRTIPMSYKRAAKHMGKGNSKDAAEWLAASVKDGNIPCEQITRQTHVFSKRSFPDNVWPLILPDSPEAGGK